MKIGMGYDIHPLTSGRKLILGGVEIPFDKGLEGYSDADVLTHAIADALLGAVGEGDIGKHFPAGDPKYKDISSLKLLEQVKNILKDKKYTIQNVDAVIVAQEPKLSPFIPTMCQNISKILETPKINIKAKSPEGIGTLGRGEGISAYAVCILEEQ